MKNLILRKNNISKIDHIDGLVNLIFLDLSFNKLRGVERSNIGLLPNIKTLICDGNYLKNVNSFVKLQSLNHLSLENNKIIEYSNFEKLAYLEYLTELILSNNPICKISGYRPNVLKKFINLIKFDNLEISKEERENSYIDLMPSPQNSFFNSLEFSNPLINSINATKTDLKKVINIIYLPIRWE